MKKVLIKIMRIRIVLACWSGLAALSLVVGIKQSGAQTAHNPAPPAGEGVVGLLDDANDALARRVLPAVVQIQVSGYGPREKPANSDDANVIERQRAIGSGVIVEPDGYIMTNAHVVAGAQRIRVILTPTSTEMASMHNSFALKQRVFDARLLGIERQVDLALIKIDEKDLPCIPLQADYRIRLGQSVMAVGSPEGLEHTVTHGIVSAVGRQLEPDKPMVYVQTDAPINPGNSGGALVDRDGNLVGINTFILSEGGGSEGLGFAIPEPAVRFVYHELREHGHIRRIEIGANPQTINHDLAAALHLPRDWGVIISDVTPGGPAEKAGLKPLDIVTSVDGLSVDSLPRFAVSLYLHQRDGPLLVEVLRGHTRASLSIHPKQVIAGADRLSDLIDPLKSLVTPLGVFLLDLTPDLAAALQGLRSTSGTVVAGIVDYSPRLDADLQVGDVIRAMNGKDLHSMDELRSRLSGLKIGDPVVLEVERQGVFQFVTFEME
jgi:serine protease Do